MVLFTILTIVASLAVSVVLSALLAPKPNIENARPAGLGDFNFPTASAGRPVQWGWGTFPVKGPNVVWYGDLRKDPITETVGGGWFSRGKTVITGHEYRVGMQMVVGRGVAWPMTLLEVKIGKNVVLTGPITGGRHVIDDAELFGGSEVGGNGGIGGTIEFFPGTRTQDPSDYLETHQGVRMRYTGSAHLVAEAFYVGNSTSIEPWSFLMQRLPNNLGLSSNVVSTTELNPAEFIFEALTHPELGKGVTSAQIDLDNFRAVGEQLLLEGIGLSFALDSDKPISDLIEEVERLIDGAVLQNLRTGQYQIKLARNDYDPLTVPEINPSNWIELRQFTKGSLGSTKNFVKIRFNNRGTGYSTDYAPYQDMGNHQLQGGGRPQNGTPVPAVEVFSMCKDPALAARLAPRELRQLGQPLAVAEVVVDRSLSDLDMLDVVALSVPKRNVNRLLMRVARITDGDATDSQIVINLVQDVWALVNSGFQAPPPTMFSPPSLAVTAIAAAEQLAFEAPLAMVKRADPTVTGDLIWAAARRQGQETSHAIVARHALGTPVGAFAEIGESIAFLLLGSLRSALPVGSPIPTNATLAAGPDAQSILQAFFELGLAPSELGTQLANLIYIGGEFMVATTAAASGADVLLTGVYRGVMSRVQQAHAAGTPVFLIPQGTVVSDTAVAAGRNVDVKLLPRALGTSVLEAAATEISFTMDNRARRPYPVGRIQVNSATFPGQASLEGSGVAAETFALAIEITRRDFRLADEVAALTNDAAAIFPDYPDANNSRHDISLIADPDGSPVTVTALVDQTGNLFTITRLAILVALGGVIPSRLRFRATHKHDFDGLSALANEVDAVHDFDVVSALQGRFNFGALARVQTSNLYTATVAGTYNFTLSSVFTDGVVQFRLNGGTWTSLIATGLTTGAITGVVATDTIEVRHTSFDPDALKQLNMVPPVGGQAAYAVLSNDQPFDPGASGTLVVWLDFNDPATITGSPLTSIVDKASSLVFTAVGTASLITVNGAQVVSFASASDRLETPNIPALDFGTDPFNVFVSYRTSVTSAARRHLFRFGTAAGTGIIFAGIEQSNSTNMEFGVWEGAAQVTEVSSARDYTDGVMRVMQFERTKTAGVSNDQLRIYDEAGQFGPGEDLLNNQNIQPTDPLFISGDATGSNSIIGEIREILIYRGELTTVVADQIKTDMRLRAGGV